MAPALYRAPRAGRGNGPARDSTETCKEVPIVHQHPNAGARPLMPSVWIRRRGRRRTAAALPRRVPARRPRGEGPPRRQLHDETARERLRAGWIAGELAAGASPTWRCSTPSRRQRRRSPRRAEAWRATRVDVDEQTRGACTAPRSTASSRSRRRCATQRDRRAHRRRRRPRWSPRSPTAGYKRETISKIA